MRQAGHEAEAGRFLKEYLAYGYFSEGVVSEFNRTKSAEPSHGLKYSWETVGTLVDIADVFARAGDTSLYDYGTFGGALGSAGSRNGQPKSMKTLVVDMYKYVTGDYTRFHQDAPTSDIRYRIDSVDELWGRNWAHDTMMQHANRYYQDAWITSAYTRKASGRRPSPPSLHILRATPRVEPGASTQRSG